MGVFVLVPSVTVGRGVSLLVLLLVEGHTGVSVGGLLRFTVVRWLTVVWGCFTVVVGFTIV